MTLNHQLGNDIALAANKITLSHISLDQGDLPAARSLGEEALALARESGSHWVLGNALIVLAEIVRRQGDAVQAIALYKEALAIFQEHGDSWGIGMATYSLASPEHDKGDFKLPAVVASVHEGPAIAGRIAVPDLGDIVPSRWRTATATDEDHTEAVAAEGGGHSLSTTCTLAQQEG